MEAVERLIQAGGDVNEKDVNGDTLLHYASRNGHVEVVNVLIQAGGDVNKENQKGYTHLSELFHG